MTLRRRHGTPCRDRRRRPPRPADPTETMTDNYTERNGDDVTSEELIGAQRDSDREITTDRLFELLSSPGNRFVLTYLLQANEPVEYADLVEYVVERADTPEGMTEAKFRGRVAAALINERLPELESAGLVEVEGSSQLVSSTPAVDLVRPYLALALSDLQPQPAIE